MKNPAARPQGILMQGIILSYSLANPAVRLRRTGNAFAIRFKSKENSWTEKLIK